MAPSLRKLVLAQVALGDPGRRAPTGRHALYTRRIAQPSGYRRHVWTVPLDGGRPRALTRGDVRDSAPQARAAGRPRAVPARRAGLGGAARRRRGRAADGAAARRQRIRALADGQRGSRSPRPRRRRASRSGRLPTGGAPLARVIDARRLAARRRRATSTAHTHLYVQTARAGARARRVTRGDWSVEGFAWSPDGKRHRVLADPRERADLDAAPAVHVVAAQRRRAGASSPAWRARAAPSPGRPTASTSPSSASTRRASRTGARTSLWVVPAGGRRAPRDLAPGRHLHLHLAHARLRPHRLGGRREAAALDLGRRRRRDGPAHAGRADGASGAFRSRASPAARTAAGRTSTATRRGGGRIGHAARRRRAGASSSTLERPARPAPPADARWRGLAAPADGRRLRAGLDPGRGGADPRHGRSRRAAPVARPLPLVLSIVGGPGRELGPRAVASRLGARGRRSARADARPARLGELRPRLARRRSAEPGAARTPRISSPCVDWAVGEGLADPARLGVTGLSYGGFMTHWLIGQSDRFRAAVAANGVANQISAAAQLRPGRAVDAAARLGAPAGRPRAPLAAVAAGARRAHHDAAADAPGRGRPALPACRQRAALRRPARARARRSSTSLYPEESHLMQRSAAPIAASTCSSARRWFRRARRARPR